LREAHKLQNIESIDEASKELNDAWTSASQDMYNASNAGASEADGQQANPTGNASSENVTDAEFEEVK
jgi:molecular chaperone DnaK